MRKEFKQRLAGQVLALHSVMSELWIIRRIICQSGPAVRWWGGRSLPSPTSSAQQSRTFSGKLSRNETYGSHSFSGFGWVERKQKFTIWRDKSFLQCRFLLVSYVIVENWSNLFLSQKICSLRKTFKTFREACRVESERQSCCSLAPYFYILNVVDFL